MWIAINVQLKGEIFIKIKHNNNVLTLVKEGNIKLNISGNDKSRYKVVFYDIEDYEGNRDSRCIYDPELLHIGWFCLETSDLVKYPNKILISIISDNWWFVDVIYDKNFNCFYKINRTRNKDILNNVKSPLIITGAPGGGTSYIAKILKYRGLHFGTDSGKISSRKPHESITFKDIRNHLCFHTENFTTWFTEEDLIKKIDIVRKSPSFYSLQFKELLEYKFKIFWGNASYNSMWGWKDPMSSITLPIWNNIFPKAKLMIITRSKENLSKNIFDLEGDWFRNKASDRVLYHYIKPDISNFSKEDVFYCHFDNVVKDIDSMNEMFSWIGVDTLKNKDEFINILKETGYEGGF